MQWGRWGVRGGVGRGGRDVVGEVGDRVGMG